MGTARWVGRFSGAPMWVTHDQPVGDFATGMRSRNWTYTQWFQIGKVTP